MPVHSSRHSAQSVDEVAYLESLRPLMEGFRLVVFCIHRSCLDRGLWKETLDARGVPWVAGAGIDDAHSLARMRGIFETFECVTANHLVSGLAYASSAGCRVSLHNPIYTAKESDWVNEPFYRQNPELLRAAIDFSSESAMRARLPWLFVAPAQSEIREEWGRHLVGDAHRKSPAELRKILGWTLAGRFRSAAIRLLRKGIRRK